MCYGGHQFGHWAGQLGDGRAINLTEMEFNCQRWAIQLKGAGPTPYSRTADGLAVLRSSVREHLCSEAMYHLGVPTTRSLSLILTGDKVLRDVMYNGNPAYELGAVVARIAPNFIRFGSFELPSARKEVNVLAQLVDYTIEEYYPFIEKGTVSGYLHFFEEVVARTIELIVHWQRVGFVHGVMNTDNMSILGLTIDYGPYGWLEGYDAGWTPNTTDAGQRRYRFGNQSNVALWNLYQLANALYPLIQDAEPLEKILNQFKDEYDRQYLSMMKAKLGLFEAIEKDEALVGRLEKVLELTETDMTIFFRRLSRFTKDSDVNLAVFYEAFYHEDEVSGEVLTQWLEWLSHYKERLRKERLTDEARSERMNAVNPKYVLRNYMAQLAISDAEKGDYGLISELHQMLKYPYAEQNDNKKWFAKRPEWARDKVGCSTLSCSS